MILILQVYLTLKRYKFRRIKSKEKDNVAGKIENVMCVIF